MKWQPIESAPKDGRPVWVRGANWGKAGRGIHYTFAWWNGSGWIEAGSASNSLDYLLDWMPVVAVEVGDEAV